MNDLKINQKYLSVLSSRLFNNYILEEFPDFCAFIQLWLEQSESLYIDAEGKRRYGFWRVLTQLDSFIDIDRIPNPALKMMIDTFASNFSEHISYIPYFIQEPEEVDLTLGEPLINFVGRMVLNTKEGKFIYPDYDEEGRQKIDFTSGELLWKTMFVSKDGIYQRTKTEWVLIVKEYSFNPNNVLRQYDEHGKLILNYENIRNFLRWSREFHKSKGNANSFYALFKMFGGQLEMFKNSEDILTCSGPINVDIEEKRLGYLDIRFNEELEEEDILSIKAVYGLVEVEGEDGDAPEGEPNYSFSLSKEKDPFILGKILKEENLVQKYRPYWKKESVSNLRFPVISGRNPYTHRFDHLHGIDPCVQETKDIQREWWYTHFAYTIVTDLDPNVFKDIVLQILHPAGFHMSWIQRDLDYFNLKAELKYGEPLKVVETYPPDNTLNF